MRAIRRFPKYPDRSQAWESLGAGSLKIAVILGFAGKPYLKELLAESIQKGFPDRFFRMVYCNASRALLTLQVWQIEAAKNSK